MDDLAALGWAVFKALRLTLDYPFIERPAYNTDH